MTRPGQSRRRTFVLAILRDAIRAVGMLAAAAGIALGLWALLVVVIVLATPAP